MACTLVSSGSPLRLGVLGCLDLAGDQAELIDRLRELAAGDEASPSEAVEIAFYDAETLPAEVVEAISALLAGPRPVKILAYQPLLSHCLLRLGLPARQVVSERPVAPLPSCQAVVMGGSACSLDKILYIVSLLPPGEAAVFIVQHILENEINLLDQLLRVRTDYRVLMPQHLMRVEAGTIYIAPPGHHMKVAHGLVYLTRDSKVEYARPSIDVLFSSVAEEYGEHALGLLLCGFGRDGVAGCAALKDAGACVIIEDGDDCEEARVLPDAACAAARFDHVMTYTAMGSVTATAVAGESGPPGGQLLDAFLEALWQQYGFDLRGYDRRSLARRVSSLMLLFGLPKFVDFQRAVFAHRALFERLAAEITVGVTGFFRHPEQFRLLREAVFPYLASFPVLKVWSAGCATGEEAYSLAIVLQELGLLGHSHLFATDINPYLLALAGSGLFPTPGLSASCADYLASGGKGVFDDYAEVHPSFFKMPSYLRQAVLFHRHSLASEGAFNEFQLIVCRNVLIYFDTETQKKALSLFARSLHPDGFLVLGPQDGLVQLAISQGFVPYAQGAHVYRCRSDR